VEINIHNKGLRSVWLGNDINSVPAPVFVSVFLEGNEKQIFTPYEVKTENLLSQPVALVFNKEGGKISPRRAITLFYQLAPGVYTIKLEGKGSYYQPRQVRLVLPEQRKEAVSAPQEKNRDAEKEEDNQSKEIKEERSPVMKQPTMDNSIFEEIQNTSETMLASLKEGEILVFFHGFAKVQNNSEETDASPKFRISIFTKDRKVVEQFIHLGDKIVGDWLLSEFSPQRETITLNYKGQLFVATIGKYYKLQS